MSALAQLSVPEILAILGVFVGALWALVKIIGAQHERRETERHEELQKALAALARGVESQAAGLLKLERDFLAFKADLPLHYVRRDDYAQTIATIMSKLDAMALRFENLILQQRDKS
jgi:hypothetical protein